MAAEEAVFAHVRLGVLHIRRNWLGTRLNARAITECHLRSSIIVEMRTMYLQVL